MTTTSGSGETDPRRTRPAAYAMLHPIALLAVGVMLLNDHALKP